MQERVDVLADKANEGELSGEEREEYGGYISASNLIAILQAKARKFLSSQNAA